METYGFVLNIAIPIFFFLYFIEKIAEWRQGKQVIRGMDSVSSFSSGITNVVKDVLGLTLAVITYEWLVSRVAVVRVPDGWLTYVIAFIAIDLKGYWVHRLSHGINFLWNHHVIHHSSEEFNLSCALRQSISEFVNYFTIFMLPAALLGVPAHVVAVIGPLHLFLQYWYHTQLIGNLGWLEHIIVTPSHHRVHHAINPEYLDKNHGQIFILWDKWFGTFQQELPNVPPVYGITRPARTWNPLKINFQHLGLMLRDAWYTRNWRDKLRLWFMPTGWRPQDVKDRFPVYSVQDVYQLEKYAPQSSQGMVAWAWTQMFFMYFLLTYFFAHISDIGTPGIWLYGAFIGLSVFAYTELMDHNRHAAWMELAKSCIGLGLIWYQGDWFGVSAWMPWYTWVVAGYQLISPVVVAWFVWRELTPARQTAA